MITCKVYIDKIYSILPSILAKMNYEITWSMGISNHETVGTFHLHGYRLHGMAELIS